MASNHFFQVLIFHGFKEDREDHAVFVQDHGVGVGATAAQAGVVAAGDAGLIQGIVLGEDHVGIRVIGFDVRRGSLPGEGGVDGDDGHILGVFRCDLVEIGQFVDAGGAPGAPEIDDGEFAGLGGINGLAGDAGAIRDLQIIAVAQVAHLGTVVGIHRGGGGILVPEVDDGTDQHGQHDHCCNGTGDQAALFELRFLLFDRFFVRISRDLVGFQEDLGTLEGDGLGGADADALAAADAFLVAHVLDIHLAVADAETAVHALALFQLDAEDGELIEQAVQGAQGADEAAKQCGRGVIPKVKGVVSLKEAAKLIPQFDLCIVAYEKEEEVTLKSVLRDNISAEKIGIFIGPEGGFDKSEIDEIIKNEIHTVSLGKRILRTETAGEAVLAMVMYEIGDINVN